MNSNSLKYKKKVSALILRKSIQGYDELLTHAFDFDPSIPLRLPGGTIEADETPEQALYREILEESGLEQLQLLRKIGIHHYYKPYLKANVERHDFLLRVAPTTADKWNYLVSGSGGDAGIIFCWGWVCAKDLSLMAEELRTFVTPEYIPELFR